MMAPSPHFRLALLAGTALFFPALVQAQPAPNARPTGGQVVAGSATIGGDAGRTVIQQSTDRAAINWQSFDVGRNQAVQFQQPSTTSVTLNRVVTPNPSQIAGQITANGQIAIVNQSGVVFYQGSTVNAAGLVVSTANISNEAFMRGGRMNFDQPGRPDARIENNGTITVREAGLAALVAPQVANHGVIRARMGRVVLAGAETSVVDLQGDGLLSLEVTSPVRQAPTNGEALVTNTGTITASGGTVVLTAQAVDGIVQDLVRAGGRVAANTTAAGQTGRVVIAGNGGNVRIEGRVSAQGRAAGTTGGDIQILGDRTLVASTARVNASGRAGGGTIAIGVTPNGAATRRLSQRAGIAPGAVVRADATERGNGGTVLLNSTDYTVQAGTISAQGGPQGGNGGFVEVSSGKSFVLSGTVNVAGGPGGQNGTLLIDPDNLTIIAGASGSGSDDGNAADGVLNPGESSGNQTISNGFINNFAGNLVLEATSNITVGAAIDKLTGGLTLTGGSTGGTIIVSAPITIRSGDLSMSAAAITVDAAVSTLAGSISLTAQSTTLAINAPIVAAGGDIGLTAPSYTATPSIQLGALVQVDNNRLITTQGNIATSNANGRFVGGALAVTLSGTNTELLNDNRVLELRGMDSSGANRFRNLGSLTVTGAVGGSINAYTSIDVVGGDLTLAATVGGSGGFGTVDGVATLLRASGNIIVGATGGIGSPTIRVQAGYDFTAGAPSLTAAGGIQLAGTIGGTAGGAAGSVELAAGTGGISQTAGTLQTQSLSLTSGGDATFNLPPIFLSTLTQGVGVDTLAASSVTGNLTLNSLRSGVGGFDLSLGTLNVGGTLSLTRQSASIVQLTGTTITANRLDLTANNNGAALTNDNRIAQLGTIDVQSPFDFRNVTNLAITGPVTVRNAVATIDVVGDLSVTGSVAAQYGMNLRATGNIDLASGSVVERRNLATTSGGNIVILAGYDSGTGASNLTGASSLTMAGTVGNSGFPTPIELGAGTGGIVQTGGQILGSDLTVRSGGNALLNGASTSQPNSVSNLAGVAVTGDFVLDNGTSDVSVGSSGGSFDARTFAIRTSGVLNVSSSITASERATFRVGSLFINSFSVPVTVTAPLVEIAPFGQVGMELLPGETQFQPFLLTSGKLNAISASTLRLGATTFDGATTTTASTIVISDDYSFPGTLDLRSLGNISQMTGTTLSVGTLTGAAGGAVQFTEATNSLPVIADLSAGTTLSLTTAGDQTLTGTVAAPSVSLRTGGALSQSGAGRISGGSLALQTGGAATLNGANAISSLTASNIGGALQLTNTSSQLSVPSGNLVTSAGAMTISQTGNLVVDGTVSGTTTSLSATGTLQVNGHSAIARTGDLTINSPVFALNGLLQAAGAIRIQASTSATLAGTASAALMNINSPNISFGGLNASATPVRLFLGTSGTATGTLDAQALSVFGGASANLFGTIAGISGGAAAATGLRGNSSGTLFTGTPPTPTQYLFNNCPIAVSVCVPVVVPPDGGTTPTPPPPVEVAFSFDPYLAPAVNPPLQMNVLEVGQTAAQQLRSPAPALSFRLYRDSSEEGELAPPNVRGEDF